MIPAVVNLHRRRKGLPEIEFNPDDYCLSDFMNLIDENTNTALLEKKRMEINEEEAGIIYPPFR